MKRVGRRFLWVSIYAIAMALLEAVVVAYLRELLDVAEDFVDLSLGPYVTLEVCREAATLVMLVAVGWIAGRRGLDRFAYGVYTFGLWDIWYYVWLKLFLDWPATILDWDILFLIPLRWWGPVLSPVLIAALMCTVAVLAVVRAERGKRPGITPARVTTVALGGLLALYVFMSDALYAVFARRPDLLALRPDSFKWPLFLVALALMAAPSLAAVWPRRRTSLLLDFTTKANG